jgi:ketosteroid isomerase-like protein
MAQPARWVVFGAALLGVMVGLSGVTPRTAIEERSAGRGSEQSAPKAGAETEIRQVLGTQVEAWNRGDVDEFMKAYWKSEETAFVGAKGEVKSWSSVMERYKRNYPDRKAMGKLSFANLEVHVICADAAYAIGEFHLEREPDNPAGMFTLNLRKFADGWKIVADHTTAFAK